MTPQNYLLIFHIVYFALTIPVCISALNIRNANDKNRSFLLLLFCLCIALIIALVPVGYGSDKQRYEWFYYNIYGTDFNKDIGWGYYTLLLFKLFDDSFVYFTTTACVYISGYYLFAKRYIPSNYVFCFLFAIFGSLGFIGYGMNTLRAGVALSFLLIVLSYKESKLKFILFAVISLLFHKSMIIVLVAFIIVKFFKKTEWYYTIWITILLISISNISFITSFIQNTFGGFDERVGDYFSNEYDDVVMRLYNKAGFFRIDFIIYSLIPIIFGWYYRKEKF
jgi:hypothetical protein